MGGFAPPSITKPEGRSGGVLRYFGVSALNLSTHPAQQK
jgi:hypothetical protein